MIYYGFEGLACGLHPDMVFQVYRIILRGRDTEGFLTLPNNDSFCKFAIMDTFLIKVPENKTSLVKKLLKELGVTVTRESNAMALAKEINDSIKSGKTLTMDEIVQESRTVRETRPQK